MSPGVVPIVNPRNSKGEKEKTNKLSSTIASTECSAIASTKARLINFQRL